MKLIISYPIIMLLFRLTYLFEIMNNSIEDEIKLMRLNTQRGSAQI